MMFLVLSVTVYSYKRAETQRNICRVAPPIKRSKGQILMFKF